MSTTLSVAREQLAPRGILTVGLNLSNSLLVSGCEPAGHWRGVAPDLARALAEQLGATVQFVPYDTPGELAKAADTGAWTIALLAADPARAGAIAFTEPYARIEAGYLVPPGSPLRHVDEVDRPGRHIAAFRGSAYGLWLERNLRHARLVQAASFDEALRVFRSGGIDALASLMPKLRSDLQAWPDCRILEGCFMTVDQSVGMIGKQQEGLAFLQSFVRDARTTGLIDQLIDRHAVVGLSVVRAEI